MLNHLNPLSESWSARSNVVISDSTECNLKSFNERGINDIHLMREEHRKVNSKHMMDQC